MVDDDLRVAAVFAVFANQKMLRIGGEAVAAGAAQLFDLTAEIDVGVLEQLDALSVRKRIFHIDKCAAQREKLPDRRQAGDAEGVEFLDELCFAGAEARLASALEALGSEAVSAEGVAVRSDAAAAGRFHAAFGTVGSANG